MRRNVAVILTIAALLAGGSASTADTTAVCPPGAKFCPTPGSDGVAFADAPFGFDAPPARQSEVANQATRRSRKDITANDEKVPWWKGGMWRNRKGNDNGGSGASPTGEEYYDDDDPVAARRNNSSGGSLPPSRVTGNDMWGDDDEYTGYNPDGSFGRQAAPAAQPRQTPPPANNPYAAPYGNGNYADGITNPYPDPYAQQMGAAPIGGGVYTDPYAAPYPSPAGGGTADFIDISAYTQPTYINDTVTSGVAGNPGYSTGMYTDPYASGGYTAPATGYGAYDATGYGTPTPYDSYNAGASSGAPTYDAGMPAAAWGGTSQPAPYPSAPPPQAPQSFQSTPALDGAGPQFENAVRMVKENRFSEAKAILASETNRNPSNAAAWRWLADCHYNLLELDDAINCYRQSLERDPNDYYALRGQGFSHLHRGHEYWRRMQDEVAQGQKDAAAATFAHAHDDYKQALEFLGLCLRRAPNDGEAIYGEAMAAEGASRKLYSNAISYLKLGPDQRERAELFAENCLTVINKGVERSKERAKQNPGDAAPRALRGGLYLRKATLYHQLGKNDQALIELRNARDVQRSILEEIDKNNATAQRAVKECEALWEEWGGNRN